MGRTICFGTQSRVNGVYLLRTNLDAAFDDNGQQTNPLTVRLTGNVTGIMKLLNRCGWQAEPESDASLPHQFSLMARQGVPGKGISGGFVRVIFSQTGHFHDSIAVNAVLQHGTGNFRHCCKVSDEAAFCLIQRPYISKTLLTGAFRRGSP